MAGIEGLDERFITTVNLEPYFVDKDTGAPLAAGSVEFWQDDSRVTPKLVYQLTGDPSTVGGYSYAALPNPVTLSGVGTIEDNNGNNIALYYFPYQGTPDDSDDSVQLYYVVVKDYLGVVQFTRSAWPNSIGSQNPVEDSGLQENQISNSQFVDFRFYNDDTYTFSYTGNTTDTLEIAPDWQLEFTHTSGGDITITRTPLAGSLNYPTNPPYWLTITPGANITGNMILRQNLPHNPGIWSTTDDGIQSYVIGGLLLDNNSIATMVYTPSSGTTQTILAANNDSGAPRYFTDTKELPLSNNPQSGETGSVSIEIFIPGNVVTTLSSVQIMGSLSGDTGVPYIQESANRQEDHLFHYYKDPLIAKPIASYLTGWDFPLNPAQFGGATQAASLAANQSKYIWDQTIIYQSVAAGFGATRTNLGALQLTNATGATAQFALIQYLDQTQARKVLSNLLSVQVAGNTSMDGLKITVSLWYTTNANLPDLKTPNFNSIVATLDATGKPATFNGTWVEVPTVDTGSKYALMPVGIDNSGDALNFEYWNTLAVPTACTTATYFAIVVGSEAVTAAATVRFRSISLVPGILATAPAPQTLDEVARECKFYYQKTYNAGTTPGTATTYLGMQYAFQSQVLAAATTIWTTSFALAFSPTMRAAPSMLFYSPVTGAVGNVAARYVNTPNPAEVGDIAITLWGTGSLGGQLSANGAVYSAATISYAGGNSSGNYINYHYVADARLGQL